jgi:hypothetical protein
MRVEFRPGRILKLYDATIAVGASKLVTQLARDFADTAAADCGQES